MTTYKELDYLESTGTQWIDTGVYGSNNLKTELKVQVLEIDISKAIFGAFSGSTKNYYLYQNGSAVPGVWQVGFNSFETTSDNIDTNVHTFLFDNFKVYDNGTLISTLTSGTFTTTQTLLLFNMHKADGTLYNTIPTRIYGCKMWNNGVLSNDFIPVLDFNNTPCMYDKVTNTYYYNQGTGQFKYGTKETTSSIQLRRKFNMILTSYKKEYTPLKYLEATRTQYIDTGFVGDQNTRIHTKIKLAANEGQTTAVFGSRILSSGTVSGSFYAYCVYSTNAPAYRIQYGYGTQTYNDIDNIDFTNPIEIDFAKNVVNVNGTTVKTFTTNTFTNPSTILLFNCHTGTSGTDVDTRYNASRLYYFQIYDNGTLVRDYIPALDKNGIPCMWDRVQNKPYYNQGTGSFNYEEWEAIRKMRER